MTGAKIAMNKFSGVLAHVRTPATILPIIRMLTLYGQIITIGGERVRQSRKNAWLRAGVQPPDQGAAGDIFDPPQTEKLGDLTL